MLFVAWDKNSKLLLLLLIASVRGHHLRQRVQSGEREGGLGEGRAEAALGEGASSGGG